MVDLLTKLEMIIHGLRGTMFQPRNPQMIMIPVLVALLVKLKYEVIVEIDREKEKFGIKGKPCPLPIDWNGIQRLMSSKILNLGEIRGRCPKLMTRN